ncbi:hypothetical protein Taro_024806 [Colocasia esculenta]|uniref:SET domain-containing protein n=1 Tax=Colocasia esculenta TaxID=4460 RepID=A0A843V1E0_COLES|nr:hypothetical protein [Colocasia esculenta]
MAEFWTGLPNPLRTPVRLDGPYSCGAPAVGYPLFSRPVFAFRSNPDIPVVVASRLVAMASATSSKALLAATAGLLSSSTSSLVHRRPLTCSASTYHPRLAPYPPDLVRWVRREGGFLHPELRIADGGTDGFGLVAAGHIPKGTRLVALPEHLPLRLRWSDGAIGGADRSGSPLFELVNRVPGNALRSLFGAVFWIDLEEHPSLRTPLLSGSSKTVINAPAAQSSDTVAHILDLLLTPHPPTFLSFLFCPSHHVAEELWAMRLGLKLLHERAKSGSFWWPYISNLPEGFNIPIFFSGEDVKNIQYAPVIHQVNKRCRFLLDFEKMAKCMLEDVDPEDHPFCGQDVTSSSLGWAMSAVSSRAFRLHGETLQDGSGDVPMLLPLIDMCNHSFHPNALIVQEENNPDTLVVSEMSIEKDAPITLNYGCLSNDLFLLDYGFVMSPNPYDHVELKYDAILLDAASVAMGAAASSFSSPNDWQKEILSQLNLLGDGALLKVNLGGLELVDGRLLAALRVVLAENMETARQCDVNTLKSLPGEAPLGLSTETAALRTVIALGVIALQHFPTKLMDDESILKGNISDSMKLAVQFRMHKKSMIIDLMRELTRSVKMLSKETLTAVQS